MQANTTQQDRWEPGLENDACTLASAYQHMPRDPASSIPWYVRLLENPESPFALGGAVDLFGHDCIHILLGRGLRSQDEAFVIGFTMGSSGACPRWQAALFSWCGRHLYRGAFRFSTADREVFEFARKAGLEQRRAPLHRMDFHAWRQRPLAELRDALGIDTAWLRALYVEEAARWPRDA